MIKNWIVLLALDTLAVCIASYGASVIQFNAISLDAYTAMSQAAEILNVSSPANWADYMGPTTSNGSDGNAQVGNSTLSTVIASWGIPEQLIDEATDNVRVLISNATDKSYTAEVFMFNTESGGSLSTLVVAAKNIKFPIDSKSPTEINYVTINTNAEIQQQLVPVPVKWCWKCAACAWTRGCCCKHWTDYDPRADTPEELNLIKQKMTADQFIWFNQQNISSTVSRTVITRAE